MTTPGLIESSQFQSIRLTSVNGIVQKFIQIIASYWIQHPSESAAIERATNIFEWKVKLRVCSIEGLPTDEAHVAIGLNEILMANFVSGFFSPNNRF